MAKEKYTATTLQHQQHEHRTEREEKKKNVSTYTIAWNDTRI